MGEEYKNFDQDPIITKVIHIKHWAVGIRELILAVLCGVLLVLLLLFAGLFGRAESELSAAEPPSASALLANSYCETQPCLDTAARALHVMNRSVDPCQNFYQFACGNYKTVKPLTPYQGSRTVLSDLSEANMDRLAKLMEKPVDRMSDFSFERKLKHFYHGCTDTFTREKYKGKPFIEQVVAQLGGWHLLGTWDSAAWDLNTVLKKVQVEYWTDALYSPRPGVDWYDHKTRAIELWPAGTGKYMYWSWYFDAHTEKYREDYKKFMNRVAWLLQRDANLNMTSQEQAERREQFVNDTFAVETEIARISHESRYRFNPFLHANRVSLRDLTTETGDVIDWPAQLAHMFRTSGVTADTKVVLIRRDYFRNMTAMIASLPDEHRNRMMHNYLIWRIAENYVQELSFEYIHANREIYVDIHGWPNFLGHQGYCLHLAQTFFEDALNSLFVANHFSDKNKEAVLDIADNIKSSLQRQLQETPWMDTATKDYAKEKLEKVVFKMGYPDWMANHDLVDRLYSGLQINISDSFANLLSINTFQRRRYDDELRVGEDRQKWLFQTWETDVVVNWWWNEVIATAGILQPPIYSAKDPHSATFGSMGTKLGNFLHHVVDVYGKNYNKNGDRMEFDKTWWTNYTVTSYATVDQCVHDLYQNASKTHTLPDGAQFPIYVNAYYWTPSAIAYTNGVRLALKGYREWVANNSLSEKPLPGLHMSGDQMVFLAHAQSMCYNRDSYSSFMRAIRGYPEEDLQVNTALGQLEEFSKAFGCKAGDKMNHEKKCNYY